MLDLENENFVLKQEIEQVKNKARQMLEDKDDEIDKLKQCDDLPSPTPAQNKETKQLSSGEIDKQYIRITLLKYLEYMAAGNEKEAMTLEKVLFTVLSTEKQELLSLEKARRKNNSGLMSYFYTPAQSNVAKPMKVAKKELNLSMEFD